LERARAQRCQAAENDHPTGNVMTAELATQRWLDAMATNLERTFPEKLRTTRERAGITQQHLAETAQLSVTGLAMIERGERRPSLDTATRICWALDVLADEQ